jgi:glycosyltransferase involved in cell wall biosynthesis
MKILYVSSNGGIHDYRFLKKLAADHEVLFLHYAAFEIIDEIDTIEHLQIISKKPAFRSMPLISERGHFKKVLKDFKPDIIHSGYVWQVGILAANSGFHPHLSMPWGSDVLLDPDKSFTIKKLVSKVMRSCDHIQCDAEFVKQKIKNDYSLSEEKITVFPWGIDLEQFKKTDKSKARKYLNLEENKFIFLFTRHFAVVYGVDNLLEAFRIFSEDKNDVMMLMLSEGPRKVEALKYISDHGLDEKIQVIGKVPNKELPAFLNASDVFVSPSISDGTSLSLLEAMACGLGLIVTDVPAIKEWVTDDNGLMVKIDNVKELIEAMEKYYSSRSLINEHGSINIKISQERANWDKNYLKLNGIYDDLLKNAKTKK